MFFFVNFSPLATLGIKASGFVNQHWMRCFDSISDFLIVFCEWKPCRGDSVPANVLQIIGKGRCFCNAFGPRSPFVSTNWIIYDPLFKFIGRALHKFACSSSNVNSSKSPSESRVTLEMQNDLSTSSAKPISRTCLSWSSLACRKLTPMNWCSVFATPDERLMVRGETMDGENSLIRLADWWNLIIASRKHFETKFHFVVKVSRREWTPRSEKVYIFYKIINSFCFIEKMQKKLRIRLFSMACLPQSLLINKTLNGIGKRG